MPHAYERSSLWRRTLAAVPGDPYEGDREMLRSAYQNFRDNVEFVAAEIALSMPEFTDHSITHVDALWDTASIIVGEETPINPLEGFVLGGAFLLHDIGMGIAAFLNDENDPRKGLQFEDTCALLRRQSPNLDDDKVEREALSRVLRVNHAAQAERIVNEQFTYGIGQKTYLLEKASLRARYGSVIGKIAHSHWLDVQDLQDQFTNVLGTADFLPSEWRCDALKLACILRTADAAQIDHRRAPDLTHGLRDLGQVSREHWHFQSLMLRPGRDDDRLVFTCSRPFLAQEANAWWLAFDTAQMVNSELRKVDALCSDLGRVRLPVRSVAGADSPRRFADFIQTEDWTPIDASLKTTDVTGIVSNLGGKELYGSDKFTALRELISNAADATRARIIQFDKNDSAIWVSLEESGGSWTISIRDRGIGMDADGLVAGLTDFGSSRWLSAQMIEDYPGLLSSSFRVTGKYGIGFFATFMLGSDVTVRSLRYRDGSASTQVLEFKNGLKGRPTLRSAAKEEWLDGGGTQVDVRLDAPPRSPDGLLGDALSHQTTSDQVRSQLRSLCALLDIDLYFKGPDEADFSLVVAGDAWKVLPNRELFDLLYEERFSDLDPLTREMFNAFRDAFEKHAAEIRSAEGELLGRAMLAAGLDEMVSMDMWWWPLGSAGVYVGGMRADQLWSALGAFVGDPLRADRNSAFPRLSPERLRGWASAQGEAHLNSQFGRPSTRYEAGQLVLSVGGDASDLPCAYSAAGFLSPSELVSWIEPYDEIFLVGDFEVHVFSDDAGRMIFIDRVKGNRLDWPDNVIVCNPYPPWIFPEDVLKRPVNDDFAPHVEDVKRDWDAANYWHKLGALGTPRIVLEAAASAWHCPTVECGLKASRMVFEAEGEDLRLEVPVSGRADEKVRIDAVRLRRPGLR